MTWPTKKLGEIIVAIVFIVAAAFLFVKMQYGWGAMMLVALIVLLKLDTLQKLILHPKDGFTAEFTLREILERKDNFYVNVHDDIKVSESVEAVVDVQQYVAEVVQVGGVNSHLYTRIVWVPEEGGWYLNPPDPWASIGFNRGGDVMWVSCKEGYEIESFSSPSGNSILSDSIKLGFCGIRLEDKLKNELTITCKKKE
jgi:hypothetical protein